MTNHQSEPRLTVDLPVRIWGMNAEGRPFSQHARAQNISSVGALISGVESELKVGDVVGVQCDEKKARCTVIWVMNTGPVRKNQVGVKLVADQECPWKNYLPLDGATLTIAPSNRRRFHRHKFNLPLELRDERAKAPTRINATDVSGNGCYVESMLPSGFLAGLGAHQYHGGGPDIRSGCGQWNRVHWSASRRQGTHAGLPGRN